MATNQTGYWEEGRIINTPNGPLNVGGGRYMTSPPIVPPVSNSALDTPVDRSLATTAIQKALDRQAEIADSYAAEKQKANQYATEQRQARINAINEVFAPRIQREEEAGKARLSRVAALNFRRGVVGSGIDTTAIAEQQKFNEEQIRNLEGQKAGLINDAFNQAESLSRQIASDAYNYNLKSAEAKLNAEKNKYDMAASSIQNFGKAGITLENLKTKEPSIYSDLVKTTGLSDLQLASMLNSASPMPSNVDTRYSNGYLISSYYDPLTRSFKHYEEKLDIPQNTNPEDIVISKDDTGINYVYDKRKNSVINKFGVSKPEKVTDEQKKLLSDYLTQVFTYENRDEAIKDLDKFKSSILTLVGEEGYNKIKDEIDKQFPLVAPSLPQKLELGSADVLNRQNNSYNYLFDGVPDNVIGNSMQQLESFLFR